MSATRRWGGNLRWVLSMLMNGPEAGTGGDQDHVGALGHLRIVVGKLAGRFLRKPDAVADLQVEQTGREGAARHQGHVEFQKFAVHRGRGDAVGALDQFVRVGGGNFGFGNGAAGRRTE